MKTSRADKFRLFLVDRLYTSFYGLSLDEWIRMLRKHGFAVDAPYLPRAALMTLTSAFTSLLRAYENKKYGPQLADVEIRRPLFILGHWRSGTTHLHNLLARDEQFAYPNMWQVLNPHTFLTTERYSTIMKLAAPKTRLMDNVTFGPNVPHEDEFATCGTLCSPGVGWIFPRWAGYYDRYLTFRAVPEDEVVRWKAALLLLYKKLTWKFGRPLVLKSPAHTARIALLLEMFPDARFVHIHRDPFAVFRSARRSIQVMERASCLQNPRSPGEIDNWIIGRYNVLYDAFFEERDLIPDGQFHEIRFEDLERDPVTEIRRLYESLGIPGFEAFRPSLEDYVSANSGYRKNAHEELPASLRREISQAWRRGFDEWNYPCD
jgi:omega-hydroxy-beta-dihydromenaquinone-9 sulfotransferase